MKKNIILGVTGSIAAFKACELIGLLRKKGYSVQCVMSPDAENFITALTLETLTGKKAHRDMFCLPSSRSPVHVSLADGADLILVAPASADMIAKVAAGICDNILTCTIAAADCPVIFAPAMNDKMFNNAVVRDKIKYLKKNAYHFVSPVEGRLACGRSGIGHLAKAETIIEKVEELLSVEEISTKKS